jgi:ribonuclease R
MTGIVRSVRNFAHRIIEEFMLAANQAVARYLENLGVASLHRVHEKPDAKRVLEFEELAHAFGYSLGVEGLTEKQITVKHGANPAHRGDRGKRRRGRDGGGREKPMTVSLPATQDIAIRPQHYQRLAAKIAGKPEERILSYLMLRSLKQARYAPEALGHFALAFDQYTHFTSPIRRYPDLIVHRILKWALHHVEDARRVEGPYSVAELTAIAKETSELERRAESAERELKSWKTAQFMEQHLGEEFEALIVSVQKFGFFVELVELFVEGLVPINRLEALTGERCMYRESDRTITCGRPGAKRAARVWRMGDIIRVRAERIDPLSRRVEFSQID